MQGKANKLEQTHHRTDTQRHAGNRTSNQIAADPNKKELSTHINLPGGNVTPAAKRFKADDWISLFCALHAG